MPNYIALAIPFFFVLIGIELIAAKIQKKNLYRFNDAITDLSCGIGSQVVSIFFGTSLITVYETVFSKFRLFSFSPGSLWPWAIGFFGVDLAYYWWHRTSHRVNFVWATHVIHHQSQDYNLAVALRQAWFSGITSLPYYLALAFLGINTVAFVTLHAFSTLYQFWIHTCTISRLGPFEWVFNSPSHHRVHHAVNPRYIDKNYAATLIIWDRLFGTFQDEDEPAVYGLVKPYKSWNPIWANFEHIVYLLRNAVKAPSILIRPPEWLASGQIQAIPEVDPKSFVKFNTQSSNAINYYVAANFVIITLLTTWLIFRQKLLTFGPLAVITAIILSTTLIWGGLFERKRWARPAEFIRIAILIFLVFNKAAGF